MSDLPTPEPRINPETEEYWQATTDDRLLVAHCDDCDENYFYPRRRCPNCFGKNTEYVESSGQGEIYARSITRQAGGMYGEAAPYVLAYVELEEGPRIMTNIVTDDVDSVEVGDEVSVVFDRVNDEASLPRFEPV